MSTFFIIILSIALILISLFSVLIILMQRPSEDAGMGSALGGGAVTSIFGGEAGNVLHRWTIASTILFFIISFILSLLYMAREGKKEVVMDLIASPSAVATSSQPEGEAIEETEASGLEAPIDNGDLDTAETNIHSEEFEEEEEKEWAEPTEEI
jgi:preprotein translocase subunit SecG